MQEEKVRRIPAFHWLVSTLVVLSLFGISGRAIASTQRANSSALVIGSTEEPDTLNPYLTQLVTSNSVLSGMMEGLLDYDSNQHLFPRLATNYSVSDNGLVYTFHLRHGVKFQNGASFSAKDVVATWKMIMNPKFGAFSTQGWDHITKIVTPDKYTVVMYTKKLYAPFLAYVGSTYISPAGEMAKGVKYFQQTFGRHPIGTGPYTFVKWLSGQYVQMRANPNYWGGKPHIASITYKIVPNDNTLMVQLHTGEVQMAPYLSAIRYSQVKAINSLNAITRPSLSWYHLDIKNIGLLRDTKVRLALAYATPVQEIISRLLHGLADPSPTDQPPASTYHDPAIHLYPFDLTKAAQLLAQDGFKKGSDGILAKNGQKLSIQYWIPSGDQVTQEVQQVITAEWRKLGVDVSDHQQDVKSIWGPNGYQFTKAMTVCGYSWFNSNDPDDSFYWNSTQIPKTPTGSGGDAPEYFYKYPWQAQIDRLTNEGVQTIDPAKRKQIYFQIQELLHQQEPLLFMYSQRNIYAAPKNMTGFNPSAFNNLLWNAQDWNLS